VSFLSYFGYRMTFYNVCWFLGCGNWRFQGDRFVRWKYTWHHSATTSHLEIFSQLLWYVFCWTILLGWLINCLVRYFWARMFDFQMQLVGHPYELRVDAHFDNKYCNICGNCNQDNSLRMATCVKKWSVTVKYKNQWFGDWFFDYVKLNLIRFFFFGR